MPKPFVFNDQTLANSYGFRILTSGISLKRFKKNPMMLNDHWNSTRNVLGKWINVKVENDLLLGEPVFDLEDEDAAKVSRKVEQDFIKSCSMGITFNREDLKIIGDELIMTKCELYECSIVAVPSNANSIRLYADGGEPLKDEEVKQLCLSLQPIEGEIQILKLNPNNDMKKITLSLALLTALSFDKTIPEVDVEAVEAAVLSLSKDNTQMKAKLLALETEKENAATLAIETMVSLAITEGRIPATKKEDFVKLASADFELAKSTLSSIPAKVTLGDKTIVAVGTGVSTKEEFQKLSLDAQLAFKASNPDEYKKMFNVK
ncbi:HK97 family phage prohead protease [Flavobacterium psychroterrae]|uniref:HK97 family phage prohead protease n=1 Tax=Flavobacterium psychroterrae TaxID=2133767 RepID=A0ABS5PIB4_9FLAO|nr:HK97 family phage prohead protease [Flavobacterium psychroterrae]MBS7234064.1 HK97 family phage prohead protease [Flavobacterium psychroterrae]